MGAQDNALREEFAKLKKRLSSISAAISQIVVVIGANRVAVVANLAELNAGIYSLFKAILLKEDINGNFGVYYPYSGALPVNNTTIVADGAGNKFQLAQ